MNSNSSYPSNRQHRSNYFYQPTVLFDTSFAGIDSTQKLRAFKPTQKVAPTTAPTTADTTTTIEEEVEETLVDRQAKEFLENKFNKSHPITTDSMSKNLS